MEEIVSGILVILLLISMLVLVVYIIVLAIDLEKHVKRTWGTLLSTAKWRPKSGIDKEIAEEEKEIAELERQKEKMDRLAELKRRKERLFKDVHDVYEETSSEYWICPQCRIKFKDLEALDKHSEMEHPF